ncbi:BspA family leucine-rich repeat surface protein [Bdellovibrio bacteriovorus]
MFILGRVLFRYILVLLGTVILTGCFIDARIFEGDDQASSIDPAPAPPTPSLIISGPIPTFGTSATNFVYTVTYSDVTTVNLTNADITLGGSDTVGCSAVVTNGTTTSATVTVSGCTGDGTVNITIAANTAQDASGNLAPAGGPSSNAKIMNSFIAVFDTRNTEGGSTPNTDVSFPLVDWIGYDIDIFWGDSNSENVNSPAAAGRVISHTYATPGIYEVKIKGSNFPWLQFCSGTDKLKITDIKQWGTNAWWKLEFMFANCKNIQISAPDAPNISVLNASGLRGMFQAAENFNSDIEHWDVSTITNFGDMFAGAELFNQPLNGWDVSSATNFRAMFNGALAFNQNISSWNTSNVVDMSLMFLGATAFNSPLAKSGSSWDTSNVTAMNLMFENADAFNQDISSWTFGAGLVDMDQMFLNANSFNQNLSSWSLPGGVSHNLFDTGAASWVLPKPTFPP